MNSNARENCCMGPSWCCSLQFIRASYLLNESRFVRIKIPPNTKQKVAIMTGRERTTVLKIIIVNASKARGNGTSENNSTSTGKILYLMIPRSVNICFDSLGPSRNITDLLGVEKGVSLRGELVVWCLCVSRVLAEELVLWVPSGNQKGWKCVQAEEPYTVRFRTVSLACTWIQSPSEAGAVA